jgi:DNA-directed RNA polymerase subunit alpha
MDIGMNYKPLILPKLDWNKKVSSDTFGELVAQPLEPGFGITLGNALRRILLSSVEGAAVTSVIIKGVNNEFSTIKGVVEDILFLSLNIKEIVVKSLDGKPGKMRLLAKGEGAVKCNAIETDENLEVINKDFVIANLASDGELDIEFFVEMGRGFIPAKWPLGKPLLQDDRIFLDARFSPISRVEYHVEKIRVGQEIDYDKLVLMVHTNGAVSPYDSVHYGTSVLRTQFENFLISNEIPFNAISKELDEQVDKSAGIDGPTKGLPVDLFLKPIDELEFSVRAHNCLIGAGVKRIVDLVNLTEDDVLKIKNFGRKSLREVKEILLAFSLQLGMNIKEIDLKKAIKEQEGKENL